MAGLMARSVADLPLMLQAISGPDGHDPEVPPVPWRQAGPVELTGLQDACTGAAEINNELSVRSVNQRGQWAL
jgi:hypothetical protein